MSIPTELLGQDPSPKGARPRWRRSTPRTSDHGAWDAPTVGDAPNEAVKGGLTTVARGVGSGLGVGTTMISRVTSAMARRIRRPT